jgi:Fic family protein
MQGVRGTNKMPGEFRNSQNWIGGATLNDAKFVPPHHSLIPDLIADLEVFLNEKSFQIPHLIRIGIAHYQFEVIHPFLDGNGRIGRLLITLYFIEKNKEYYYANLSGVSNQHDMLQWLKFFLTAISETAKKAIGTFNDILALRDRIENKTITVLGKRIPNAKALLNYLYSKPVITLFDVMNGLEVSKQTANVLIQDFQKLNILEEQTGYKRNRIYIFKAYMQLFDR